MSSREERLGELLHQAQEGDGAARQALFDYLGNNETFVRALYSMVHRLFSRDHRARSLVESHDLVQSAICSGLEHFDGFRGESELELYGWFRSILRSKLSRATRRCRPANEVAEQLGTADATSEEPPLGRLVDEELRESLREGICELPMDQRLVIELRMRGANASQIGRILRLKPATVRKRESRAVKRLRRSVR